MGMGWMWDGKRDGIDGDGVGDDTGNLNEVYIDEAKQ